MNGRPPESDQDQDREPLENALSAALRTTPLSTQALERVRQAAEQAWRNRAQQGAPRGGRFGRRALEWAAAAGLVVALVGLGLTLAERRHTDSGAVVATLVRSEDAGVEVHTGWFGHHVLQPGEALRVGTSVTAQGAALFALAASGSLRVAAGTAFDLPQGDRVGVQRGRIYLDTPPGQVAEQALRVITRAGVIEHLGTQYEVLSSQQAVRVRVREGRIRLTGPRGEFQADAGTELLSTSDGRVMRQGVSTYGREWLWTAALAPDFAVEGRPVMDFLKWASRELGRPLVFADQRALERAQSTILHGSVQSQDPLEALGNVLASTTLSYSLVNGTIRVQTNP